MCYSKIVKIKINEKPTEKIDEAIAKNDLLVCDEIHEQFHKDICYFEIAKVKNDSSICEQIHYNIPGGWYRDYCYYTFVECSKIQYSLIAFECYHSWAAVQDTPITV